MKTYVSITISVLKLTSAFVRDFFLIHKHNRQEIGGIVMSDSDKRQENDFDSFKRKAFVMKIPTYSCSERYATTRHKKA
ncbi:CLUMA_CG010238, isoform A [Clunio marinus]|uniref:CLUMA_CG010238, isoform A n=1 Tax=Clunio marinus TaxID=568069 RepID=A0A1J1I985_9DIPT|nr:CLUMA_CG010238, isoform A [Clunio marinus]